MVNEADVVDEAVVVEEAVVVNEASSKARLPRPLVEAVLC